jgi:integrase
MGLTVNQLRNASPGRHSDGGGLYLLVKPTRAMSWVLRVQYRGVRRDFGIGSVDLSARSSADSAAIPLLKRKALTLAEAREKAGLGRALAKAGINPSLEWKGGEEAVAVPTFEEAARGYHAEVQKTWRNGKHGDQWINTLETYAFPSIGALTVDEIDAPAIRDLLLPIWLEKGETARRVRQRVLTILDYSKGQGWRDTEAPVRSLASLLKGLRQPRKGNFAAMAWADLPGVIATVRAEAPSVGRLALLFTFLSVARSGEVRGATWREIDWEAAEWRIPGERMKAGALHIIPLVPAAMDVLAQMRDLGGCDPAAPIFPGNKGKPLSDATMAKAFKLAGGVGFTVHGSARSGFRDWAADNGFADAWAEAALAHGNPDRVEAAYRRTSYLQHRRDNLMPAWARFVLGDASNVVSLAAAR